MRSATSRTSARPGLREARRDGTRTLIPSRRPCRLALLEPISVRAHRTECRDGIAGSSRRSRALSSSSSLARLPRLLLLALLTAVAGCAPVVRLSLRPFYRTAPLLDEVRVERDIPYVPPSVGPAHPKQRLDLYHSGGNELGTLVFVHGGSFEEGDKDLQIGGLDIYGNVGRFYAAHGLAVAVVDYRLQPEVTWPDQVDDVAAAVAWTVRNAQERGRSGRIYLSGHSAGAWLASRVALDDGVLALHGLDARQIAGVIAISGSGFDLTDRRTWELYPHEDWWAERFWRPYARGPWQEEASLVPLVDSDAPPFLLLHADSELRALERQNRLFLAALRRSGVKSELVPVRHGSHRRIVLAMSREDREVTERILEFVGSAH